MPTRETSTQIASAIGSSPPVLQPVLFHADVAAMQGTGATVAAIIMPARLELILFKTSLSTVVRLRGTWRRSPGAQRSWRVSPPIDVTEEVKA